MSDNNLNPKEERTFEFKYRPATQQDEPDGKITKNRLDAKSAAYNKLTDEYPLSITIFDKKYDLEVK
ncbi:MAG: hypothetical protein R2822_09870 [Spirosomataceae bacterium]